MSHLQENLFDKFDEIFVDEKSFSKLTILCMGAGQDSMTIFLKICHDKEFRKKYAPHQLLVLFADTGNEHPFTYDYIDRVLIPLCKLHNIEFVKITNDMGFHSRTWKTLTYQWKLNTPTIGSMGYPKSCTHNLKLLPQYNYLGDRISKKFNLPKGNKREYVEYAKYHGKIRFLIGIAKNEEKRVNGSWHILINNNKILGHLKTIKGIEYFVTSKHGNLKVSYKSSDRYIHINKKEFLIEFTYNVKYKEKWKRQSIITEYPLLDIGYDRTTCQQYINSLNIEVPFPSNCIFCPFSSGSHMEILWLYMNLPLKFEEWVILEENKLNHYKNNHNIVLNKLAKPHPDQKKTIRIDLIEKTTHTYLKEQLEAAIKTNTQITINCLKYIENSLIENFINQSEKVIKINVPNLGATARLHKDGVMKGKAFTLNDMLKEAKEKYPNVTLEELQRYKFSHGNCVQSQY